MKANLMIQEAKRLKGSRMVKPLSSYPTSEVTSPFQLSPSLAPILTMNFGPVSTSVDTKSERQFLCLHIRQNIHWCH